MPDYVGGMMWLSGEPGWCFVSKSVGDWHCVKRPGFWQLEQETDGQGTLVKADWATSHG